MTVIVYGIKNCDTIKKARKWLDENNISYQFHDFRIDGIDRNIIEKWLQPLDWNVLLNTRSTTWRKLPEQDRTGMNKSKAITLMLAQPTLIKRPVLSVKNRHHVGFKTDQYEAIFK